MANVSSNNLTTLYSGGGVNVRPTSAYGNANVVSLLNVGTDGGNTVTNIIASGNLTTGGEINSTGNVTAPWFLGNVIGNISGNIVVPGSNTAVLYNDNGNAGASDNLKFNFSSNVLTANGNIVANYFIGNGSGLSSLTGSNVTGQVGYAAVANSVALANVSGAGNIASINIDGSASNVLYGNGVFAPGGGGNAANANYANFAGTAFNVSASNVSGLGNIAVLNLDGNVSNVLSGNGSFVPLPTVSANANYANFAGTAFSVSGSNVSGEVANAAYANAANTANLASFATTANSVAGANVSGEVANANFASYANIASSANSVALANVSGIGNIANINLDGSSSNVLFGNGVFAPESTSIANANYANFAGTAFNVSGSNVSGEVANANYASYANVANTANSVAVGNVSGIGNIATINLDGNASNALLGNGSFGPVEVQSTSIANGTSNINIPTANGNINFSANNNANLVQVDANGTVWLYPTTSPVNALRVTSYGTSIANDTSRITSFRARGNSTTPLSVQPNDATMRFVTVGHNGTSFQTNSVGSIRAIVDSSYTANGTNIPIGWQIQVNDTNGGINNQSKTQNFYANGNVTFAQYVNATGYFGDGGNLSNLTGANVTGQVPYANVANSVAVANVSGIGNIATINLDGNSSNVLFGNGVFAPESTSIANANYANFAGQVVDATQSNITSVGNLVSLNVVNSANVTGTIQQLAPNTITITTNATNNTAYNLTTIYGETSNVVESGQRAVIRSRGNISTPATVAVSDIGTRDRVYFYNGTTNAIGFSSTVTLSNLNSNSNAYSTGASYNISVGNPNGDQGNANASSGFNLMQFNQNGQLLLLPGANSSIGSMLQMYNYGQPASLSTAQGITMSRARGNRDGNLSVQANDNIGRIVFQPHNGTSFVTNRLPILRATVDSSYTANTANIPAGFQMITCDNTTSYTHNFYANGNIAFSGRVSAGNLSVGDIICGNINAIGSVIEAGNSVRIGLDNNTTQGILQTTYNNANIQTGSWTSWRQRGTKASPLGVQAGDEISKFSSVVYADSGNTYVDAVTQLATVVSNDGAGNVVSGFRTRAFGGANSFVSMQAGQIQFMDSSAFTANATIYANGFISTIANISSLNANLGNLATANYFSGNLTGNTSIANLSLTKFQETVVSGGTVSGTLTPNSTAGTIYNYTLNGNITINALGNAVAGTSMTLILTQDGTGNRVLSSTMKFAGGLKTLSTAASATDIMSVFYDGSTYYATLSRGFV
jgi:hypothetical protein